MVMVKTVAQPPPHGRWTDNSDQRIGAQTGTALAVMRH